MTYLFWAYAAVWVGIFLYLFALLRKTQTLAGEVEALREQSQKTAHPPTVPAGRPGAGRT